MNARLFFSAMFAAALLVGCAGGDSTVEKLYSKPLNSPGTKFSGLPPAVQNTVRAEAGAAEIADIVKSALPERTVYEVHFENAELFPALYIGADGSVLKDDLTVAVGAPSDEVGIISGQIVSGMKLGDLPKKVIETVQKRALTSELSSINRETRGAKTYYELGFKDSTRYPSLFILEDGTILSEVPE